MTGAMLLHKTIFHLYLALVTSTLGRVVVAAGLALVSSSLGRVVVAADLGLDAATPSNLDDGPAAAARRWPSEDRLVVDAASGHRLADHIRKTREECCLASAWESMVPFVRLPACGRLQPALEVAGVGARVMEHVDVDRGFRAVPGGVDDKTANRVATLATSRVHAGVVVANIAAVDALNA